MLAAVVKEIDGWFETRVFAPLRDQEPPDEAIAAMFDAVESYFHGGRRVCLIGVLALGDGRGRFGLAIEGYFSRWVDALTTALLRTGFDPPEAASLAESAVAAIQGALVLAQALGRTEVFGRALDLWRRRLCPLVPTLRPAGEAAPLMRKGPPTSGD